jgi:hypothetical protein
MNATAAHAEPLVDLDWIVEHDDDETVRLEPRRDRSGRRSR